MHRCTLIEKRLQDVTRDRRFELNDILFHEKFVKLGISLDKDKSSGIIPGHFLTCVTYFFYETRSFRLMVVGINEHAFNGSKRLDTNGLKDPSKFGLEYYDEHYRKYIKELIEQEAYHLKAQEAAKENEYDYENDTFDELPCPALLDKQKCPVKEKRNKQDIADRPYEVTPSAKEEVAVAQTSEQFIYEISYLIYKRQNS